MAGQVSFEHEGALAHVTLHNPGKRNAIDMAMWRALWAQFTTWQALPLAAAPRAIIVTGSDGQFASGGDIVEFAAFRFERERLKDFHERLVAPALQAILNCDIPVIAAIEGACVGGGLEIAACCDIRIGASGSRYGAPIGKLGFPMAPGELEILARVVPMPILRTMLLEARLFDAEEAHGAGLLHARVAEQQALAQARERALQVAALAPAATRMNKITLRQVARGGPTPAERQAHFDYADSPEHREGVQAFIEKRAPRF